MVSLALTKKNMKKLIIAIGLGVSLVVNAAEIRSLSFFNQGISAVMATNTLNITNLLTAGTAGTNTTGTIYTNNGVRVVASTNFATTAKNLLKDVQLVPLLNGAWPVSLLVTNGSITYNQSLWNLSITGTGASGANTAVAFVFTPIPNGTNEVTTAAEEWTVGFTPTTSQQTIITNVPLWRWPGVKQLRLRRIVNTDTDASGEAIFTDISLNGPIP